MSTPTDAAAQVRTGLAMGDAARLALLQEHRTRVRQHLDELTADLAVIDWKIAAYTAAVAGTAAPPPPPGWPRTTPDLPEGTS